VYALTLRLQRLKNDVFFNRKIYESPSKIGKLWLPSQVCRVVGRGQLLGFIAHLTKLCHLFFLISEIQKDRSKQIAYQKISRADSTCLQLLKLHELQKNSRIDIISY
jgi:hypothetical protein